MESISISVRSLIEYSLKSGSIDFRYQGAMRAVSGIIFHQRVQKKREAEALLEDFSYEREVSFKENFIALDINIEVKGRADGILRRDGKVFIEEIKTTQKPLDSVSDSPLHIAQAKCYAYFYLLSNELDNIWVLLTYCNINTFELKQFEYCFTLGELEAFFNEVLHEYAKWAKYILHWRDSRNHSIKSLPFPFESYRAGQREMSVSVYRAIERKRKIFVNAPTGIGKTISSLFPAIKAIERGKAEKIFYLTAKTITGQAALSAVLLLAEKGLFAKTIVITAKDKVCFLEKSACNPQSCQYADGHLDRINGALTDILKNENIITKQTLTQYAEKHRVCPYEFSLDIALFSDIIICDYNYAFDPRVYLRRFFSETTENYIFLIDEAHNLVDRAREMYSAKILLSELKNAARLIKKEGKELKKLLTELCGLLAEMGGRITDEDYGLVFEDVPENIYGLVREYCQTADKWLEKHRAGNQPDFYEIVLEIYFSFNHFINISQMFSEKFICYCERDNRDIILKLFCLNPSERLSVMLENAVTSVFFSATLSPLKYFKDLLGAEDNDYAIMMDSPFPKENIGILAGVSISTKYKNRSLHYEDIADYIKAVVSAKNGNYFVFFPSYAFLSNVYEEFVNKYPDIKTIVQSAKINESEKEAFLAGFEPQSEYPFAAFAVLGGMFSEGVDLPGEMLIGAIIVSVGLPKLSFERSLISSHFNKNGGCGFEYSYMYPGMNKVLQAGGRVIRTMTDKGIIVLIDERFSLKEYNSLFPKMWSSYKQIYSLSGLVSAVDELWRKWN